MLARLYTDPLSCSTLPNIPRYSARRDLGLRILGRLTKRSYRESCCERRLGVV